jgi:isoleucyl-tRNA synthetase
VYQALQRFTVLDLSSFYLDAAKDRLYVSGAASPDRRACQTVLAALLEGLLPLIAPLLPHMAEDAWQNLPYTRQEQSGGLHVMPCLADHGPWMCVCAFKG